MTEDKPQTPYRVTVIDDLADARRGDILHTMGHMVYAIYSGDRGGWEDEPAWFTPHGYELPDKTVAALHASNGVTLLRITRPSTGEPTILSDPAEVPTYDTKDAS